MIISEVDITKVSIDLTSLDKNKNIIINSMNTEDKSILNEKIRLNDMISYDLRNTISFNFLLNSIFNSFRDYRKECNIETEMLSRLKDYDKGLLDESK